MNDKEKKELLTKDISELESIKAVKLGENKNIIEGNTKLHEVKEQKEAEVKEVKKELSSLESKLEMMEAEQATRQGLIDKQKAKYAKMVSDNSDMAKELIEINKLTEEANKEKEKASRAVENKENEKFMIGRLKEVLTQMFDEMRPIYVKAGADFPYGTVEEVLSGLINKTDAK